MWNNSRRRDNRVKSSKRDLVHSHKFSKNSVKNTWNHRNEINKELIRVALYPNFRRSRIYIPCGKRRNYEQDESDPASTSDEETDSPPYIKSDGIEEIGQLCYLCEKDMSLDPLKHQQDMNAYEAYLQELDGYYNEYKEGRMFPDVSVLACGHCFHSSCLDDYIPDDEANDPSCGFCLSLSVY